MQARSTSSGASLLATKTPQENNANSMNLQLTSLQRPSGLHWQDRPLDLCAQIDRAFQSISSRP